MLRNALISNLPIDIVRSGTMLIFKKDESLLILHVRSRRRGVRLIGGGCVVCAQPSVTESLKTVRFIFIARVLLAPRRRG